MTMIDQRPAEAAGREEPGHWEGDLSTPCTASAATAKSTAATSRPRNGSLPCSDGERQVLLVRRSLTWDQGKEMALHAEVTAALGMPVYFCEKASPRQRPSNENTNGLLRQYFPKGRPAHRRGRPRRADRRVLPAPAAAEPALRPRPDCVREVLEARSKTSNRTSTATCRKSSRSSQARCPISSSAAASVGRAQCEISSND